MCNHSTNGYLAPEMEVIDIKYEGVLCESGNIPSLTGNPSPLTF